MLPMSHSKPVLQEMRMARALFSTCFFESDDKEWNIYRDEYVKETGLTELMSPVFFDMNTLLVLFVLCQLLQLVLFLFVEAG